MPPSSSSIVVSPSVSDIFAVMVRPSDSSCKITSTCRGMIGSMLTYSVGCSSREIGLFASRAGSSSARKGSSDANAFRAR
jgi:hypothetical protein